MFERPGWSCRYEISDLFHLKTFCMDRLARLLSGDRLVYGQHYALRLYLGTANKGWISKTYILFKGKCQESEKHNYDQGPSRNSDPRWILRDHLSCPQHFLRGYMFSDNRHLLHAATAATDCHTCKSDSCSPVLMISRSLSVGSETSCHVIDTADTQLDCLRQIFYLPFRAERKVPVDVDDNDQGR